MHTLIRPLSRIPRVRRVLLCTLLLTGLGGIGSAYASCGPGDAGSPCAGATAPASQPAATPVNLGAGNPINVITGNKYQQEVDMPALPGVLVLEIVRHYNSALSGPQSIPGSIGRGWKLSYETTLYALGNTIQIMQADGTRTIFSRDLLDRHSAGAT